MLRIPRLLALILFLASAPVLAQAPHADWRTIETARFRIHYPAPWETWAVHAASRLEQVRDRVEAAVGWEIEEKVDVLIMDPVALANGSAWPFVGWPRMILYTNPPPPESVIGANRDWIEILTVHETAHLAHLLRPSRNRFRRLLTSAIPLGPIVRAPRWVSEGYATLIEGDLTGTGRPNSDFRASVLRQWGRQGRLPSYGQLDSDRSSWMGMSMAYLVGSAYLEWLREREGPDSLQDLWARMTARESRSFEAAFRGVFGDSPATLYRRFSAELTAKAIAVEPILEPTLREGELWQDLSWTTEEPDVAADGSKIVTVLRSREEPSRMVVLATGPNTEAEKKERERIEKVLERDPEDVAPVRRTPLPREPLHQLPTRDRAEPFNPRWMPDQSSVLFVRFEPDADGFFHPDLFRWTPESGAVERLTRFADIRDADPAPDGRRAVAVRNRHGFSELVLIDLETAAIDSIAPPSVDEIYASPVWSPTGDRIAHVRHERGSWRLFVRDTPRGTDREIPLPDRSLVAQPAWGPDPETLYAAIGSEGRIEIHRIDLNSGTVVPVTRSFGASLAPALAADGSALYFLSIDADGFDLRRLGFGELTPLPPLDLPSSLAPAVRPEPPPPVEPLAFAEVGPSRSYGIGRQEFRLQSTVSWLPSNHLIDIGGRLGDVVGRLSTVATAAVGIGDAAEEGGALASVWRGWPVAVRGHIFTAEQSPSEQPACDEPIPGCTGVAPDLERTGGEIGLFWDRAWRTAGLAVDGGIVFQQLDVGGMDLSQRIAFVQLDPRLRRRFGKVRLGLGATGRHEAGETEDERWSRTRFGAAGEAGYGSSGLALAWTRDTSDSVVADLDRYALGGTIGSIFPRSALANRIESPALPIATALGDEHESQKASLAFGFPLRAFYQRHRLWNDGGPKPDWIELAGLEGSIDIDPMPIVRLPGLELRIGVARVLTAPLEDETTWWIATAWRP